jgi:hypothetical protein
VAAALVGFGQVVSYIAHLMCPQLDVIVVPHLVVVKMENVILCYLAEPGATSIPDLPQVRQLRKLHPPPILMIRILMQRRDLPQVRQLRKLHPPQILMIRILMPLAKKAKDNPVMDQTGRLVALMEFVAAVLVWHLLLLAI